MTNIGTLGYNSIINQAISKAKSKSDTGFAEIVFDNSLLETDFETADLISTTESIGVPDRWTSNPLYTLDVETLTGYRVNEDALEKVRNQIREEGMNPDTRIPTHEITDEQMEWLESRYNLDFLSNCNRTHPEYGNFMLDLAYLNVFSIDEVRDFLGVQPFNINHQAYLYMWDKGDGVSGYVNPFGGSGNYLSEEELKAELIMEYIKAKYSGYSEQEYKRIAEEYTAQRQECFSVLKDFFARVAANNDDTSNDDISNDDISKKLTRISGVPYYIQDISYKLKEDFGGLI